MTSRRPKKKERSNGEAGRWKGKESSGTVRQVEARSSQMKFRWVWGGGGVLTLLGIGRAMQ